MAIPEETMSMHEKSRTTGVGFAFYIQGNWTFVNYGEMDGSPINWENYAGWAVIDTFLWIAIIVVIVTICLKKKKAIKYVLYVSIGVICIEIVTLITLILTSTGSAHKVHFSLVGGEEFHLSKNMNNVVVICADGFDGTDLLPVFKEEPELEEFFDGFTFYIDTVGTSLYSEESGITLLTGNQFVPGLTFKDNVDKAYTESNLYDVLDDSNYKTYLFCNEKMVSDTLLGRVENLVKNEAEINSIASAYHQIYKMVAFRYMPHILKRYFWYSSMDFSSFKAGSNRLFYNYHVYDYLVSGGLTAKETGENIYQFFWIQGPHAPANTDRYCKKIDVVSKMDSDDFKQQQFEQTIGVVRLFSEIITQFKKAGIYDNSTIIFVSDHGWDILPNPLLMIKPTNAHGSFDVSDIPVSMIEDYLPTLEYFINNDGKNEPFFSLNKKRGGDRRRPFFVYSINSSDRTYNDVKTDWYETDAFSTAITYGEEFGPNVIAYYSFKGFSRSEGSHIWTNGNEAILGFDINDDEDTNIKLDLTYGTFNGKQNVELYANDVLISAFTADGDESRSFVIPKNAVKDDQLSLRFVLPDAIAPADVNKNSTDSRKVALAFKSMTLSATVEEF